MKKSADDIRSLQQGAKGPQRLGFHVGKGEDAGTSEPVRFDFPPDPFAGIQLRTIPGEQIQAQLAVVALDRLLDLSGFVHRMTIPNQKTGALLPAIRRFKKRQMTSAFTPFSSIMNRIPPRRFTALIMLRRYRAPDTRENVYTIMD